MIEQYTMTNERHKETEAAMRMAGLDREKKEQELLVLCLLLCCISTT
jgi:hypothetical protein